MDEAAVLEALREAGSPHRSLTRSANESLDASACRFAGAGANIRITIDTAPDVRRRYFNRLTEQQLSNVHRAAGRPQPIEDLGDEDAYGPAGAYWIAATRQLFALDGERLLIVGFSVRGMPATRARGAAEQVARVALDRPAGSRDRPAQRATGSGALELSIISPVEGELVRAPRAVVRGIVAGRDVRVRVAGRDAEVRGGVFARIVPLRPGKNRIGVIALSGVKRREQSATVRRGRSARRVGDAFARRHPGVVPDLLGERLDVAEAILSHARIAHRRVELASGPVVAREWAVCLTRPSPGERVGNRRRVVLLIDRADIYRTSGTACAQR